MTHASMLSSLNSLHPLFYLIFLIPITAILAPHIPTILCVVFGIKLAARVLDAYAEKKEGENEIPIKNCFVEAVDDVKDLCGTVYAEGKKYFGDIKSAAVCGRCRAELVESKTDFIVEVDLPGLKKEDIRVETDGYTVNISGNRPASEVEEGKRLFSERAYGEFTKSVVIPDSADMNTIMAKYENGVLSLMIHKREEWISEKKTINID